MSVKVKTFDGDIILLSDGRLLRVLDSVALDTMSCVQFVDRDECCYINIKEIKLQHNFGKDPATSMNFQLARGLHLRLNKLAKI